MPRAEAGENSYDAKGGQPDAALRSFISIHTLASCERLKKRLLLALPSQRKLVSLCDIKTTNSGPLAAISPMPADLRSN
jgi:hypothetical protein